MLGSRRRFDPYKTFNFRMLVGIGLTVIAGLAIGRKLRSESRYLNPGDYLPPKPDPPRPIEGVGTTTAGRVQSKVRPRRPKAAGGRRTTGK
jgi:hypothetical protein